LHSHVCFPHPNEIHFVQVTSKSFKCYTKSFKCESFCSSNRSFVQVML